MNNDLYLVTTILTSGDEPLEVFNYLFNDKKNALELVEYKHEVWLKQVRESCIGRGVIEGCDDIYDELEDYAPTDAIYYKHYVHNVGDEKVFMVQKLNINL